MRQDYHTLPRVRSFNKKPITDTDGSFPNFFSKVMTRLKADATNSFNQCIRQLSCTAVSLGVAQGAIFVPSSVPQEHLAGSHRLLGSDGPGMS